MGIGDRVQGIGNREKISGFLFPTPHNPLPVTGYRFTVKVGKPKDAEGAKLGTTAGKRAAFRCLLSDVPVTTTTFARKARPGAWVRS